MSRKQFLISFSPHSETNMEKGPMKTTAATVLVKEAFGGLHVSVERVEEFMSSNN